MITESERKQTLSSYQTGNVQVIVNVAVLAEGWDYQPTSCIVLLRPSSFKSTMIQMIGRGLRTVDPNLYPNLIKEDCIIMDFGTSSLTHGCLEVDAKLEAERIDSEDKQQKNPKKQRPESKAKQELTNFEMLEFDLLTKRSNFKWCDLFGDKSSFMACGFNAYSGVFLLNNNWYTIGGSEFGIEILFKGTKQVCLAKADDFLNNNETYENAHKSNKWLNQPASVKQINCLPAQYRNNFGLTKYMAANLLKFHFNKTTIQNLLFEEDKRLGGTI